MSSRVAPTFLSEGANPGLSAFVDSHIRRSTPSFPSSPNLVISIILLSIGVTSSLKSPE